MTGRPLISVIVPIFNVEEYLPKCVDSILSQSYDNLEVILVDDGSPDGCPDMCEEYRRRDTRVRVIHKENGGLSDARNVGMDIALGEYIFFLDSDDWLLPEGIETLYVMAEKYDADISVGNNLMAFGEKEPDRKRYDLSAIRDRSIGAHEALGYLFSSSIPTVAWDKLYSRKCVEGVRFPVGVNFEDYVTSPGFFERAENVVVTDREILVRLYRRDSISGMANNSINSGGKLVQRKNKCARFTEYVPKYPEFRKNICIEFQNVLREAAKGVLFDRNGRITWQQVLDLYSKTLRENWDLVEGIKELPDYEKRKLKFAVSGSKNGLLAYLIMTKIGELRDV